ncbi:unnamed protein product [Phaedon cochleariae]|uniref:RRM domain-containing protein n=1 Tax=Phaedon cochleariae TaxID=80249 RepID=A0A9P0GPF1_PHACE|nr:unnamed protein product [Phaedon cochleariae]
MAAVTNSDTKIPLTVAEDPKTSAAHADEDSILKLNSENNSDAEPDSPQRHNKDEDPKKTTSDPIQKNAEASTAPDPEKREATGKSAQAADRKKNNFLWVSNIHREVKAADLKALFSKVGKVCTAKILTNGKSFYGYVSMENYAVTLKCVKQFNNTLLDGVNITVSKSRPDLTANKPEGMNKPASKRVKKTVEDKVEDPVVDTKAASPQVKPLDDKTKDTKVIKSAENKPSDDQLQRTVATLTKKVDDLITDNTRLKRKLDGYQKRHDVMRNKCISLEREVKKLKDENRDERRNLSQERQNFERDRAATINRIKTDRETVAKNLEEVRKLKERLKFALARSSSPAYKRERSPYKRPIREVSPVAKPQSRSTQSSRLVSSDRSGKRSRNDDYISAPPAPKLDPESSRKRYSEVTSTPHFDFRHRLAESTRVADHWSGGFPKDSRSKPLTTGYPFPSRYSLGVPQGSTSTAMSRSSQPYYQQW